MSITGAGGLSAVCTALGLPGLLFKIERSSEMECIRTANFALKCLVDQ